MSIATNSVAGCDYTFNINLNMIKGGAKFFTGNPKRHIINR